MFLMMFVATCRVHEINHCREYWSPKCPWCQFAIQEVEGGKAVVSKSINLTAVTHFRC